MRPEKFLIFWANFFPRKHKNLELEEDERIERRPKEDAEVSFLKPQTCPSIPTFCYSIFEHEYNEKLLNRLLFRDIWWKI